MIGQILAAAWILTSVAFLVLVILSVRRARARSKRLFVDGPTKRAKALHQSSVDHSQDGWY